VPRGLIAGTVAATALVWGLYAIGPGASLLSGLVQSGIYLGLFLLTTCSRRAKVLLVRTLQRYTINPLVRLLLAVGINPLGVAILETRGHASGKTRRVPVGNGRKGDSFWIIAEHGTRAGYVRNIQHDPQVRVRLRIGLRYRWVPGIATVCPDDDPLAPAAHHCLAPAAHTERDQRPRTRRRPAHRARPAQHGPGGEPWRTCPGRAVQPRTPAPATCVARRAGGWA
jgi:deazaflavin-dependent oxidoreductase (nitroreductase family)